MAGSVVIIGAGLGGLECGYILARHGFKVTVLEQNSRIGGCLQTYSRGGLTFDTGFHYVGGLDEGQSLRPLFDYFGLMDLPWTRMDPDCFDEVVIGGASYPFACGHERFADTLAEYFPSQRRNLHRYAEFLKSVGDNILAPFRPGAQGVNLLFSRNAKEFLDETIDDPLLRKVLSGTSLKMELRAESLPLYVFAQSNNSYIQSAWRLLGGGGLIADALAAGIRSMGGEVRTGVRVAAVHCASEDGIDTAACGDSVSSVETAGGERIAADWVISDIHPALTLNLVGPTRALRRIYRSRIGSLPNTGGMFTASLALKKDAIEYLDRNVYVHSADADLWHPSGERTESVLVHFYPGEGRFSSRMDLLSPMSFAPLERWKDLPVGRRGDGYKEVKRRKFEACMDLVSGRFPQLRDAVDKVYTSTPLTWLSYVSSPEGSAYGLRKDCGNALGTVLSPRSPLPNLFFTGQSVNLHGVLGVSMTSVMTCSQIPGMEDLPREIFGKIPIFA